MPNLPAPTGPRTLAPTVEQQCEWRPPPVMHVVQLIDPDTDQVVQSWPARTEAEVTALVDLWTKRRRYRVRTLHRCPVTPGCYRAATAVIPHQVLGEAAACDNCQRPAGVR